MEAGEAAGIQFSVSAPFAAAVLRKRGVLSELSGFLHLLAFRSSCGAPMAKLAETNQPDNRRHEEARDAITSTHKQTLKAKSSIVRSR